MVKEPTHMDKFDKLVKSMEFFHLLEKNVQSLFAALPAKHSANRKPLLSIIASNANAYQKRRLCSLLNVSPSLISNALSSSYMLSSEFEKMPLFVDKQRASEKIKEFMSEVGADCS
jgi:hypothetical protein